MFHADITLVLAIIALVSGAFLILAAKAHKEGLALPCKIIGFIAVVLAALIILFSGYGVLKRAVTPHTMRQQRMAPCMMMKKMQGMHMIKGKQPMMRQKGMQK